MNLRTSLAAAVCLCIALALPATARAAVDDAPDAEALCEEETVYGTVIVLDEVRGVFGLLGTKYKFQSMEELDLEFLQGRMVRIDIGSDCGILDLRVLDGEFESVT